MTEVCGSPYHFGYSHYTLFPPPILIVVNSPLPQIGELLLRGSETQGKGVLDGIM